MSGKPGSPYRDLPIEEVVDLKRQNRMDRIRDAASDVRARLRIRALGREGP